MCACVCVCVCVCVYIYIVANNLLFACLKVLDIIIIIVINIII